VYNSQIAEKQPNSLGAASQARVIVRGKRAAVRKADDSWSVVTEPRVDFSYLILTKSHEMGNESWLSFKTFPRFWACS
jgi:hypothetical protein